MSETLRTVTGPPAADEQYRARALRQLWKLRDEELTLAGQSTPAHIATRVSTELGYPQPMTPKSKFDLDQDAHLPQAPHLQVASWCDPDRQIVTGEHRAQLMQWLPEVVGAYTTQKQMRILDGYTEHTSLAYVRELLASEGFEQVCDVHGNAGPAPAPRELYDYHPVYAQARRDAAGQHAREHVTATDEGVALVLCSRADGFLATVHATATGDNSLWVQTVTVFYNVMLLDRELYWYGAYGTGGTAYDDNREPTTIGVGSISNMPVYRSGGSLRVGLAVLRAFARPVAPWYDHPFISFGESRELRDRLDEILTGLPGWVHDLLGPQLTTPYHLRSGRAA